MRHHIGYVVVLLGALAATPGMADTTQHVPTRIGNVYNGTAHEPDPTSTIARERAAGIAGSDATRRNENSTVEQLYQQLERNARMPMPSFGMCSPDGTSCMP